MSKKSIIRSAPKTAPDISAEAVQMALRSRYNPIRGLTMQTLVGHLDNFQLGYLAWAALLWETMEKRDSALKGVIPKRKKAVSRLKLEILQKEQSPEAEAHAEALREFYDNLTAVNAIDENERGGLALLIRQMMDCVGKYYSVHEIVWQPGEVLTAEFRFTPLWFFENRTGRLRYLTTPVGGAEGLPLEDGGWMVTKGEGLMEACSILYAIKNMPLKDWLSYCDKFGTPGVLGQTTAAKGSDAGNAMRDAVAAFNQNFAGVIYGADGTIKEPISIISAGQSGELPFEPLVEWCERRMAILWRGSDLSTFSADNKGASVQGEESDDLLVDDATIVSESLNHYVDRWVLWQKFGTRECLAFAKLVVPQKQNTELDLKVDKFLLESGAPLGTRERLEHYGRPQIEEDDTPLHAPVATTERVTDNIDGKKVPGSEQVPNEASGAAAKVADHLAVPLGWIAPIEKLLSELSAKVADQRVSDADLLDFFQQTRDRLPELFGEMDTEELSDVFENALGSAVIEGVRSTFAQKAKKS